jgi:predicted acylesterase/phospholipase RssA
MPAGTRVGIALGSGSMHGLAHIGVLKELEARGLKVDVVAGTSVGALVGPVPVIAARELGANFVIGVDVAYRPYEEVASGMTQYAFQAMHILVNSLSTVQMRSADLVIHLNLHHRFVECGNESLIAAGREAVAAAWPDIARAFLQRSQRPAAAR